MQCELCVVVDPGCDVSQVLIVTCTDDGVSVVGYPVVVVLISIDDESWTTGSTSSARLTLPQASMEVVM